MRSKPASGARRWEIPAGGCLIAGAAVAAYLNSWAVPFLFDDGPSIADNPTIRHFWSLGRVLRPPHGQGITVEGRPVLNLSLAFNYALSGLQVGSYHAVNLGLHILAGLTLFGILRRTIASLGAVATGARRDPADPPGAWPLGLGIALLWVVHPLQTESVTYLVQRAESLMGLCYLLTLYGFIRYADDASPGRTWWAVGSVLACLLGMGTKEVMVSAPVMVFLYDRTFVSGSFGAAWGRHRRLHAALAATWLVLIVLVIGAGNRGGTSGAGIGVGPFRYWATQFQALAHYLWLSVWPHPLIFDYGTEWVGRPEGVVPYAVLVAALLGATAAAFCARSRGRRALGFAGVWFFAILAPTSLVPGNRQTLAEHRMYLALIPVLALAVFALRALARRALRNDRRAAIVVLGLVTAAVLVEVGVTLRRNEVYQSALRLYGDIVAQRPNNPFGRYNLGKLLDEAGRPAAAVPQYREAIRLRPEYVEAYDNLGNALGETGQTAAAVGEYETALRLNPRDATAHYNLGNALVRLGRKAEAAEQYQSVLRIQPGDVAARDNLGSVFLDLGRLPEALAQYEAVLAINPNLAATHYNLGSVYRLLRRRTEAIAQYERTLQIDPGFAPARAALAALGSPPP